MCVAEGTAYWRRVMNTSLLLQQPYLHVLGVGLCCHPPSGMWWVRSSTSLSWGCFRILLQVSAWDIGRKAEGKEEAEDKSHGNSAGSENQWGNKMSQRAVGLEVATLTEMTNFFISRVYIAFLALTVLYLAKDFQSPLFMLWSLVFW